MELQLVSKEVAVLAKKLGFNEPCLYVYYQSYNNSKFGLTDEELSKFHKSDKYENTKRTHSKGQPHIILAPEQELLAKWLRDVHNLLVIISNTNVPIKNRFIGEVHKLPVGVILLWTTESSSYTTYEEAMETALLAGLNYIKEIKLHLI